MRAATDSYLDELMANGNITLAATPAASEARLVETYCQLSPAEREQTLILTSTREARQRLTQALRHQLQDDGELAANQLHITGMTPKHLTVAEAGYASHYEVGDVVVPLYGYRQKGVQADSTGAGLSPRQRYEVVDIQRESNTLTVRGEDGQVVTFDPAKCVKKLVYQPAVLAVAVGDRLRWTRNDRQQHRRNGQELTVEAIYGTQVTAVDPSGQRYEIDAQTWQYLDYAWGSTIHSAQGKTADRVMVLAHDNIDQESFYVACSRVKHHLSLYTDSLEHLRQQAHRSRRQENVTDYLSLLRTQYAERAATVPPQETTSSESVEPEFSRVQASPPAVPTSHPASVATAAPRESPDRTEQIRQQANEYRRQWVKYRDQLPATLTGEWLDRFIARQAWADAQTPDQVARIIVCGLNAGQYPAAERAAYAQRIAEDAVNHQTRQQQPRRRPPQKQPQRGFELE